MAGGKTPRIAPGSSPTAPPSAGADPKPVRGLFREIPPLVRLRNRIGRRLRNQSLSVYAHPAYRPPLAGMEAVSGFEPRRAEMVATWLVDLGLLEPRELLVPQRATIDQLSRVHAPEHLEALASATTLARIFALDPSEVPVDEVMHTMRLAVGGTIEAARAALAREGPVLNLLGGFHHAGRTRAGGLSPLNDVAVAIAAVRDQGVDGVIAVLDLDAHPPDGTADCVQDDTKVWIGSISGSSWDLPSSVDETCLPAGTEGPRYLQALDGLLRRMPDAVLTFVLAGGDVLAGDRMGALALTLDDAAQRDLRVAERLDGRPSVWLPAGGYHRDSWRVLATTAAILATGTIVQPRPAYDPVRARILRIGAGLDLGGPGTPQADDPERWFDSGDLDAMMGLATPASTPRRLLGYYSAESLELALHRYGVLEQVRRLGYGQLRVEIEAHDPGDRFRLVSHGPSGSETLVEAIVERIAEGDDRLLYIHWLTLRHPRARFSKGRAALPGQDVPGLGMAKEAGELMAQMARRLGLAGVAFRPAALHVAYAARHEFRFVDTGAQAEFSALLRDLRSLPLGDATRLVSEGRVCKDGARWSWPAELMVCWLDERRRLDDAEIEALAAGIHFAPCAPPTGSADPLVPG